MNQDIYVMRVWYDTNTKQNWRITVTDTRNQQKYHFANLDKLMLFFKEKLENNLNHQDNP